MVFISSIRCALLFIFCLIVSSSQATEEGKPCQRCWTENEKCMSYITTFSQKFVDDKWLREYGPPRIKNTLPSEKPNTTDAKNSSNKWKIGSLKGKIYIEFPSELPGNKTKEETFHSMSNEEWAEHCNKTFDCEAACKEGAN